MSEQSESSNVPRFELRHRMDLAMESAGLKVEDMAGEIGRSVTTIRNYLAGRTTPTRAVVTAWALRCKVDRDWLAYGIEVDPGTTGGEHESSTRWYGGQVIDLGARRSVPTQRAA
jgi:transcriptional regulator with XRE-family HTH domain